MICGKSSHGYNSIDINHDQPRRSAASAGYPLRARAIATTCRHEQRLAAQLDTTNDADHGATADNGELRNMAGIH